jgi:hypothetical protein
VILGVVTAIAGLGLAIAPLGAAQLANHLRFVPYARDEATVRYYRIAGGVMALLGVVVAGLLR